MAEDQRKVHVLDDNDEPFGPVLCGKTSTQLLGDTVQKTDRLCIKCAIALLARVNEYADRIDDLSSDVDVLVREAMTARREVEVQKRQLAKKDRMLLQLVERQFDEDELGDD